MSMQIVIATEDELSETVAERLVQLASPSLEVSRRFRRDGFGYLKSRVEAFCNMAKSQPLLLLTDLDQHECPPSLVEQWLDNRPKPEGLMFRVAVREVEAWLLADHDVIAKLIGKRSPKLPQAPDTLPDPKRELINFARRAPSAIRKEIVPPPGAAASQGLGYNAVLCPFVREHWDPFRAAERSESLRRALDCVRRFSARTP